MVSRVFRLNCAALALLTLTAVRAAAGGFDFANGWAETDLQVGGFVAVAPKYEGSKEYRVYGFPIVAPSGYGIAAQGTVQFRGVDDLRFRLINYNGFEFGPLVGWRFNRKQSDAERLNGLGDIDGGAVAGAYVAYRAGMFMPYLSYHNQVTGDNTGGLFRFGLESRIDIAPRQSVTATVGASYGDDTYMDTYFSVTPAQSAASLAGLSAYNADAGFKSVFLGLTSDVPLSESWILKLSGRYVRLVGDAASSPIVEEKNQFYAGLGLTYVIDLTP